MGDRVVFFVGDFVFVWLVHVLLRLHVLLFWGFAIDLSLPKRQFFSILEKVADRIPEDDLAQEKSFHIRKRGAFSTEEGSVESQDAWTRNVVASKPSKLS